MNPDALPQLPVQEVLPALLARLRERHEAVLQAPPGAGKTTLVPLVLLDESWLGSGKILVLEPRRIAARAAAERMADLLGEKAGDTVGYRMRLDTRIGPGTRIEVVTEGILTRMLQRDPSLDGVGLVVFDEFHERSLDADVGLTLTLQGRALFRDDDNPLKVLVMSATLDAEGIARVLNDAPVVTSDGRQFPVETRYESTPVDRRAATDRTVSTVVRALDENPAGSVLVFLPGQAEITRVHGGLKQRLAGDISLFPLYGNLSPAEQRAAIAPLPPGQRKVVIATNIAETSLTIDGIDVVVDSGLVRESVFDPTTGMDRLQTRMISAASSEQRRGRAGRLRPGHCYRLWTEAAQHQLAPQSTPEILRADLAPLALTLLQWGTTEPGELDWVDAPPPGPWQQARDLLLALGAATREAGGHTRITPYGEAMAQLPLHPRLAHMLIRGLEAGHAGTASLLAAALSERGPVREMNDVEDLLTLLRKSDGPAHLRGWRARVSELARRYDAAAERLPLPLDEIAANLTEEQLAGFLIASAWPDRIARRRHSGGYQLANGRSGTLEDRRGLGNSRWLAVAELTGSDRSRHDRIRLAASLDAALFEGALADLVTTREVVEWDRKAGQFVAESQKSIGQLVLAREKLPAVPAQARREAVLEHLRREGIGVLPWTPALRQWQARVLLVRSATSDSDWPDVSDDALILTLEDWLGPWVDPVNRVKDLRKIDLAVALNNLLGWQRERELKTLAPLRINVPSGSSIAVDYTNTPPVLAVKLQEMFGYEGSPSVCGGRVNLLLHLLSPAGRPLQITQDLAGFWRSSYRDVRKEMLGRYPKHPWPEDPANATPTRHTKRRS